MNKSSGDLWHSTFQPDSNPKDLEALRSSFLTQRSEVASETLRACNKLLEARGLEQIADKLLKRLETGGEAAALVIDDPVFAVWLRFFHRAMVNERSNELEQHLSNLNGVLEDIEARLTGRTKFYAPGSSIVVQREELNPYLMAAAPPTYDFTRLPKQLEDAPIIGHPLEMQAELVGYAIEGIGRAWPEMRDQVFEYVRIVGYLPDATFRSCSAARYSGLVYLGNMDESTLDIEESLVHETGHQVLYRLGEMTRLTRPDAPLEAGYVLPWSGSRRDLFGFLHAYYIYVLLTKYFWRRAALGGRYANDCTHRALLILRGVLVATPMLQSDRNLSDQGCHIVEVLAAEAEHLKEQMRDKLREHEPWQRKKAPSAKRPRANQVPKKKLKR